MNVNEVICISVRADQPDQLIVGRKYKLDIDSIFGDIDGDWYGTIYEMDGTKVGFMMLKHFKSACE